MDNFQVGALVKFRGREWVVDSYEEDLVSLRPLSGGRDEVCGAYLPLEASHIQSTSFPAPSISDLGDFGSARLLRDASRLLMRDGASPLRSIGNLSSFTPRPYQLAPLLMALRLSPIRMLIADDVGIGKTIEAGLIARELLDRGEIQRICVVCPPYLCDQWQSELFDKFNIDAKIIRTNSLARLERELPRKDLNVFEYFPHIIVSVDFAKGERVRNDFILHCPNFVIVDEAHGCARPAGQSISQQQRHKLINDLAKRDNGHLLLVTATPHSGIEEAFMSLLGLLKPQFTRIVMDAPREEEISELARHFVQRRRADVIKWDGPETSFPVRDPQEAPFKLSPDYNRLFNNIYSFCRETVISQESQTGSKRRVKYWAALALLRCVMSSPAAAVAALRTRLENLAELVDESDEDLSAHVFDPTEVENIVDVTPSHVIDESRRTFSDSERRKLADFSSQAKSLLGNADTKIATTAELVVQLLKDGYNPICFCRFIATADYVADELKKRLANIIRNVEIISVTGAMGEEERQVRVGELAKSPNPHVLVATDCLSEGLSLQGGFNAVVHYDLPWNPNRLEQREGRVDRFGQKSPTVKTCLIYGADNPIDAAVLKVLIKKARSIHKALGITVPIPVESEAIMETLVKALFEKGLQTTQMGLFDDDASIKDVNLRWDRAVEREKTSRTRFAQRAIKPAEVAEELDKADKVLGNQKVVESFVKDACQRLGSPLKKLKLDFQLDLASLPDSVRSRMGGSQPDKIAFEAPCPQAAYISRSHPLVEALAEYLFDQALNSDGNRSVSARCGVIRSREVAEITTLLLLRYRYLVHRPALDHSTLVEECLITGFTGLPPQENWLPLDRAKEIFETVKPTQNLQQPEKEKWLSMILQDLNKLTTEIAKIGYARADELTTSHEKLRQAIKGARVRIEPKLPPDILAVSVIVPEVRD